MAFFTAHARARAKERYGIDLSVNDMSLIAHSCNCGAAALLQIARNGAKTYCFELRGVRTFPLIRPDGLIITFRPADFFIASAGKKHRLSGKKQRPSRFGPKLYKRKGHSIEVGEG